MEAQECELITEAKGIVRGLVYYNRVNDIYMESYEPGKYTITVKKVSEYIRSSGSTIYDSFLWPDELLDETGAPVDMGTPVDFFGDEAHTGNEPALAAEGRISAEACRNRQLLGSVMREAGLVPYRREWWHYEEPMAMSEVRIRYKLLDF